MHLTHLGEGIYLLLLFAFVGILAYTFRPWTWTLMPAIASTYWTIELFPTAPNGIFYTKILCSPTSSFPLFFPSFFLVPFRPSLLSSSICIPFVPSKFEDKPSRNYNGVHFLKPYNQLVYNTHLLVLIVAFWNTFSRSDTVGNQLLCTFSRPCLWVVKLTWHWMQTFVEVHIWLPEPNEYVSGSQGASLNHDTRQRPTVLPSFLYRWSLLQFLLQGVFVLSSF